MHRHRETQAGRTWHRQVGHEQIVGDAWLLQMIERQDWALEGGYMVTNALAGSLGGGADCGVVIDEENAFAVPDRQVVRHWGLGGSSDGKGRKVDMENRPFAGPAV